MGCRSAKDNIESEMLYLKLERILIRQERNKIIKKFFERTGEMIERNAIPDYVAAMGNQEEAKKQEKSGKDGKDRENVPPEKNIQGDKINVEPAENKVKPALQNVNQIPPKNDTPTPANPKNNEQEEEEEEEYEEEEEGAEE